MTRRKRSFQSIAAEDSLDRWHGLRQLDTTETNASSWDYRSLSTRPQNAPSTINNGTLPKTVAWHDPGQYAWPNSAHGERMLGNQRQAIDARMKQFNGQGTVRSASPGTTFTLAEHPEHDRDALEQRKFLITAITHEARNALQEAPWGTTSPKACRRSWRTLPRSTGNIAQNLVFC